jgi:RimJ/RimL family protein N-acetyltransferase
MEDESRVLLSPLNDCHIHHFISLSADPELVTTMGWKPFRNDEKERFLQTIEVLALPYCKNGKAITFSIISATDRKAIGYISIKGINEVKSCAEIGIAITDKKYRDQGCGTEALRKAVDYAYSELELTLLGLTVFPSNERAIRAYEKVGFHKKELLKDAWLLPNGEYADMWLMERQHSINRPKV